uniref:ATP synthase F0 subunit 8 n=1 Tax=Arion flagellus TaxID=236857 RepID=UPI00240FEE06|nr:ATP synthase F0 subunit 8 [Arion flagellus]WES82238.1 ATP synthase F0 subunit 8 [Arion flagellus]
MPQLSPSPTFLIFILVASLLFVSCISMSFGPKMSSKQFSKMKNFKNPLYKYSYGSYMMLKL